MLNTAALLTPQYFDVIQLQVSFRFLFLLDHCLNLHHQPVSVAGLLP